MALGGKMEMYWFRALIVGIEIGIASIAFATLGLIGILLGGPRALAYPGAVLACISVAVIAASSPLYIQERDRNLEIVIGEIGERRERAGEP